MLTTLKGIPLPRTNRMIRSRLVFLHQWRCSLGRNGGLGDSCLGFHKIVTGGPSRERLYFSTAPKRRRRPLRAPINVTENAANRIKEIIGEKTNIDGVRLGVRTRGCNGMSYTMNYVETGAAEAMDEKVEEHGVKVYIDPKALFHIIGTTMDFKEDHISSEFTFENPNATGMCGCGESFSVGDAPEPRMMQGKTM